jgi:hypothetical protein
MSLVAMARDEGENENDAAILTLIMTIDDKPVMDMRNLLMSRHRGETLRE